jgi:hypothetical protein
MPMAVGWLSAYVHRMSVGSVACDRNGQKASTSSPSCPPCSAWHNALHNSRSKAMYSDNPKRVLEALKDGKVRMTCSTWEDANVLAPGEMLGLRREGTFWWSAALWDET